MPAISQYIEIREKYKIIPFIENDQLWRFALAFLFVIGFSACTTFSTLDSEATSGTATAQARRSVALATHQAGLLKETYAAGAAQATATEQAKQEVIQITGPWPVIFSEPFSDNSRDWPTGQEESDLASISWQVGDGKYLWEALAHQGFVYWARPEIQSLENFHIDVEAQQINGAEDGQAGVIFRQTDSSNYYLYRISQDQFFALHRATPENWVTIIDWTPSDFINSGKPNKISVTVAHTMILLFVNDHLLGEAYDHHLESGRAGVAIGLSSSGDKLKAEFDNFQIRAPSGTATPAASPEK